MNYRIHIVSTLLVGGLLILSYGCSVDPTNSAGAGNLFHQVRYQDPGYQDPAALGGSGSRNSGSDSRNSYPGIRTRPSVPQVQAPVSGNAGNAEAVVNQAQVVKNVLITGNQTISTHDILKRIRTRPGRYFDPDLLQQDVNDLWKDKHIRRVNGPYLDQQPDGILITIDVSERPYINEVRYVGNRGITDREIGTESGLANGQPLDLHEVKLAKNRIEDLYVEKGYPRTQVTIAEGTDPNDRNVVFVIHEDVLQRVRRVSFEGNLVASDGRLKSFIQMKPGILYYIGGNVNRRELEQDKIRLESYYRRLGYFNARIGRELSESESGKWLDIRYIINEGPRYKVRTVSFIGNEKFTTSELHSIVNLKPTDEVSPEFNVTKMNDDVGRLEDLYGSRGYVNSRVQAEPRFLETPGLIDLVYNISEGEQYRVGEINIIIDGEYGVTQRQVILNRLGLRPGDLMDTRKIQEAERRIGLSQLFATGSPDSPGAPPRVAVRFPDGQQSEGSSRRQAEGSSQRQSEGSQRR